MGFRRDESKKHGGVKVCRAGASPVGGAVRLWEGVGRELKPLLWLSSGDSEYWVSTGLYVLTGQNAEVSLPEAVACPGLKVRPEHPLPASESLRAASLPPAPGSASRPGKGMVCPFHRLHR